MADELTRARTDTQKLSTHCRDAATVPALGRLRREKKEFRGSLGYVTGSKVVVWATQRDPTLRKEGDGGRRKRRGLK